MIRWKNEVNSRIYVESESEAEKALCGKLETYLIRFCLVIQVMRGICGEADMNEIDEESADRAIRLTEYFRAMESRIAPEMEVGMLDLQHTELLSLLPSSFTTSEAVGIGKRFLRRVPVNSSGKRRTAIIAKSKKVNDTLTFLTR